MRPPWPLLVLVVLTAPVARAGPLDPVAGLLDPAAEPLDPALDALPPVTLTVGTEDDPLATVAISAGEFLVGYKDGHRDGVILAIQVAGGSVEKESRELRTLVTRAADAARFSAII